MNDDAPPRRRSTRLYGDMDGLQCDRAFADPPKSHPTLEQKDRIFRDACIMLGLQWGVSQSRISRVLGLSQQRISKLAGKAKRRLERV
jgi:predicted XRE-type DNA-binding protein